MSGEQARFVTADGGRRVAPARWWTERSVFVEGALPLRFAETVHIELPAGRRAATVALVAEAPRGALLVFDRDTTAIERWEEDETGRHDAGAALEAMTTQGVGRNPFDSEEPTNPGIAVIEPVTGPIVPPLDQPAAPASLTRLGATTEVAEIPEELETEDTDD